MRNNHHCPPLEFVDKFASWIRILPETLFRPNNIIYAFENDFRNVMNMDREWNNIVQVEMLLCANISMDKKNNW